MHEPGERDRAIDQVLRQSLRQSATGSPSADCLDADALAAWASGSLRGGDAGRVERHVSECARCQAMLAAFVRTEPAPQAAEPVWRRWRLQWLVPLATAATAIVVWVNVPGRDSMRAPTPPAQETVARELAAPAPSDQPVIASPGATAPQMPPSAPAARIVPAPSVPDPRQAESRLAKAAPTAPAAVPAPAPVDTLAGNQNRTLSRADERPQTLQESVRVLTPEETERLESDRALAAKSARAERTAPPPSPAAPAAAAPPASPVASPAPAASDAAGRRAAAGIAATLRQEPSRLVIVSPNGPARWRVTAERQLEFSGNAGDGWEALAVQEGQLFVAGSSPGGSVCWLVGRAGAVHLTTDGRIFTKLPFPEPRDLVAVRATDERTATVTTVDGRAFRTTDRGLTWTAVPQP